MLLLIFLYTISCRITFLKFSVWSLHSILNKLTPEKFDVLKGQLIEAGITTADILKVCLFPVL
jgi:hypothetical protein